MICLLCRQAEIVAGLTSMVFVRDEMKLIVNEVPARICPHCGEAYVEEDIAVRLLQDAEEVSRAGVMEQEMVYNSEHPFS